MASWEKQACPRKAICACAVASLVLLVGLVMFVVIYLTFSRQDITGEDFTHNVTSDLSDDDCRSKATVVTDEAMMQKWAVNFSEAWSDAERNAREPSHEYMDKLHSTAVYMYSNMMLRPAKPDLKRAERTRKHLKETFFLYSLLSKAIQILKHSQVTCLHTNYRTETLLHPNISSKLIRFSTFTLGSDRWNFTRKALCFDVYTCFGADVTRYSALKLSSQVLIPPFEVFRVTDVQTDTGGCEVVYRLKSNLNCVYDTESNKLHPISALPAVGFWLIFAIACLIIVCLLLPFAISKVLKKHKKNAVYSVPSLHNSVYTSARADI